MCSRPVTQLKFGVSTRIAKPPLFTTKRAVALISLGKDALDPKLDHSTKTTTLHYALVNVAVNA